MVSIQDAWFSAKQKIQGAWYWGRQNEAGNEILQYHLFKCKALSKSHTC